MRRGGPGFPAGSATISQSFGCGNSFESGSCVVALDYMFGRNMDAAASMTIKVDGNHFYTANHTANVDSFLLVTISVGGGLHTLEITGSFLSGNALSGWAFWIDNVTAECVPAVPVDAASWGTIKSWHRWPRGCPWTRAGRGAGGDL